MISEPRVGERPQIRGPVLDDVRRHVERWPSRSCVNGEEAHQKANPIFHRHCIEVISEVLKASSLA
jgi:hypothetical protein